MEIWGITITPELIFSALSVCIQVIVCGSYFNMFQSGAKIRGGYSPGKGKWANMGFYNSFSLFCYGMISLFFAIAELGLVLKREWFYFIDSIVLRAVVYCIKGIATLGTSGDLGITAGSMEIIMGVVMIVYFIVRNGLNCLNRNGDNQVIYPEGEMYALNGEYQGTSPEEGVSTVNIDHQNGYQQEGELPAGDEYQDSYGSDDEYL